MKGRDIGEYISASGTLLRLICIIWFYLGLTDSHPLLEYGLENAPYRDHGVEYISILLHSEASPIRYPPYLPE